MDENAQAAGAGKPSELGGGGGGKVGLGGIAKKGLGGMQTRRGLKDITNKTGESSGGHADGAGKGGKKPGARVASASVGRTDTGVAAPSAPGTLSSSLVGTSSATAAALSGVSELSGSQPGAEGTGAKTAAVASAAAAAARPIRTATRTATDIDQRDAEEPLAVTEYVEDLYVFLREKEIATQVDRRYMDAQPNVNERMRSILIDWLVEVHLKFKLVPDTLYLTVYLIDKYLSLEKVREVEIRREMLSKDIEDKINCRCEVNRN